MHPDPMEPMPRNPFDDTAADQLREWPSLDTEDHPEADPAL
ncbi:hypothetical protein EDF50_1082 [Frigoribacterium sp. PhB24]|nr:hypothetical protein EDF50_1082 [Frigoribacterium sp. PhB24]